MHGGSCCHSRWAGEVSMKRRVRKEPNRAPWFPWGDHPWVVTILVVTAVLSTLASLNLLPMHYRDKSPSTPTGVSVSIPLPKRAVEPILSVEASHRQITALLQQGQLEPAIELAARLAPEAERKLECEHLWNFGRKNSRLNELWDKGKLFLQTCWDGEERHTKMEELGRERLSRDSGGRK